MRFAYADPPYLGQGKKHYSDHPEAEIWDGLKAHRELIDSLREYDGWVLSASASSLTEILPLCPYNARVLAWVKPFAAFKKNVNPSYAWEPLIVHGGRRRTDDQGYMRDWVAEPITLRKGLTGAKPKRVCFYIFDALNAQPGDELVDLFPGTGIVTEAWTEYMAEWPDHASNVNRVSASWERGKYSMAVSDGGSET